ncbi:hypothetical protein VULLAG_LOCUS15902 [Vulpes lagopus]
MCLRISAAVTLDSSLIIFWKPTSRGALSKVRYYSDTEGLKFVIHPLGSVLLRCLYPWDGSCHSNLQSGFVHAEDASYLVGVGQILGTSI